MRIAIHQPNYIPWLGFFHKIAQVERFVFFDNVACPQGKSWVSRNRINLNGHEIWLTVPTLKSGHTAQLIRDVRILYQRPWVRKHLGTIMQAFGKSPFFDLVMDALVDVYDSTYTYLADFNIEIIERICRLIGLRCEFMRASERLEPKWLATDMIVQVCRAFEATEYLSGTQCLDFLEVDKFPAAGIAIQFQSFEHPVYTHLSGQFLPNLSVLDALFCVGPDQVRSWIEAQPN